MAGIEFKGEPFIIKLKIREYSKVYDTIEDLQSVEQSKLQPGEKARINDTNKDYEYISNATTGNYAPIDQINNTGFWVQILNGSYISFNVFLKVRAYLVHEYLNQSMIAFSTGIEAGFKPMVNVDEFTNRLIIEAKESEQLKPGLYYLEIHKYIEDSRFENNQRLEIQKIKLWTLKDSIS